MGRCFAGTQVLGFRVFGVIHFVYLQNLLATDDDERLIQREPQDFIRSKYRAFSNTRGLTKLRCIVGDTPGAQLFGLTGYCYGGKPCPGRNKFGSKLVCTAQKQLRVTVSNNLLPQILRVSVLQSCEILEHTGHGDIPGAYYAEPAGEVWDRAARCQFFPKDMDRHRQFAALAVVVCISHQFDEAER